MKKLTTTPIPRVFALLTLTAVLAVQSLLVPSAYAAPISARSLTLQAMNTDPTSGVDGGSRAGGTVRHFFQFTLPSGADISSIRLEYCTTAANDSTNPTCVAPTGMDASGATLTNQTGETGFTVLSRNANTVVLSRALNGVSPNTVVSYTFDNMVNPVNPANPSDTVPQARALDQNTTFFVRIKTYSTPDGSGTETDAGVVAASTANQIILTGTMPESLVFCTGETIGLTVAGVPDCTKATRGIIRFNQLFSPGDTSTATSQMAASTNAGFGYVITVNGTTLTSGSNTISSMATKSVSSIGVPQFGLNLVDNVVVEGGNQVDVGANVTPTAGPTHHGEATTDYASSGTFKYVSGDIVAASTNGSGVPGVGMASDAQIYTVSYIANVPGSLAAGDYSTTLTYICTPTF